MEYTVQKLASLSGVSARTLRYYDEIGLLKPARVNSSGYRIYGGSEVEKLQQILFYRELGMSLEDISDILADPGFNSIAALRDHREKLACKRSVLDKLIANVDRTLAEKEGGIKMTDAEKFEGFKKELIAENERKYGKEAREKYGSEQIDKSNEKLKGMSQEQYDKAQRLASDVMLTLEEAFETGDPAGKAAQKAADLHRQWLCCYWDTYSKEAHAGLARMYTEDERFTAYYDKKQPGMAAFLRDAILIYTGMARA